VIFKGSAAGPRPKIRAPTRGESVGGVCPDDDEWAVIGGVQGEIED